MKNKTIYAAVFAIFMFAGSMMLHAGDNSDYRTFMQAYSSSQKLAGCLANESVDFSSRAGSMDTKNMSKYKSMARKSGHNSDRLGILGNFSTILESQGLTKFKYMDRFMEDIRSKCVEECAAKDDILFAIAICKCMDSFLKGKYMISLQETKDECLAEQRKIEEYILNKTKDRFDDSTLKAYVEAYKKLFPQTHLLFDEAKPAKIEDCYSLMNKSLQSFDNLDKFSAVTDFDKWGANMLNVLLLNAHPVLMAEFENQLKLYRKTFKIPTGN